MSLALRKWFVIGAAALTALTLIRPASARSLLNVSVQVEGPAPRDRVERVIAARLVKDGRAKSEFKIRMLAGGVQFDKTISIRIVVQEFDDDHDGAPNRHHLGVTLDDDGDGSSDFEFEIDDADDDDTDDDDGGKSRNEREEIADLMRDLDKLIDRTDHYMDEHNE